MTLFNSVLALFGAIKVQIPSMQLLIFKKLTPAALTEQLSSASNAIAHVGLTPITQ